MSGSHCRLDPIDPDRHADDLHRENSRDESGANWTYLAYGPFSSVREYREWMIANCLGDDPLFYAIVDNADGKPKGVASYLRIAPAAGTIEVGHLQFSPALKRSTVATEAMFLMMARAFELGYRRYEWKCDSLNVASRKAAERLGFTFEGIFRNATVYKGRSRDTAWYSIVDREWPAVRDAFVAWLNPLNFDSRGEQKSPLRTRNESVVGAPVPLRDFAR
jgi:RimJ/RimL family protein N-acetyltransferase